MLPDFHAKGATLVTLSPQLAEFSKAWADEDGIEFAVLQDLGLGVARDFRLTFRVPDYLQEVYVENFGVDLTRFNGDESWELPIPATYVVGTDGIVQFASVDVDYTTRAEPSEVLNALT